MMGSGEPTGPDPSGSPEGPFASPFLRWPSSVGNRQAKEQVAANVAAVAKDGDTIGIGSGSNSYLALRAIARRVRDHGLSVRVIASSVEIEIAAANLGLSLASLRESMPTWAVDGADEVDDALRVLKGRGGAMFREKVLWMASPTIYLVADASKRVARLGSGFPLPIEVHPSALELVLAWLHRLPFVTDATLRLAGGKDGPVITESGFLIVDAAMSEIPEGFHAEVKTLPGVLETGLFEGFNVRLVRE
jgi:ribose 5-phosphate isomerase A